jgi:hypothetical protein
VLWLVYFSVFIWGKLKDCGICTVAAVAVDDVNVACVVSAVGMTWHAEADRYGDEVMR